MSKIRGICAVQVFPFTVKFIVNSNNGYGTLTRSKLIQKPLFTTARLPYYHLYVFFLGAVVLVITNTNLMKYCVNRFGSVNLLIRGRADVTPKTSK